MYPKCWQTCLRPLAVWFEFSEVLAIIEEERATICKIRKRQKKWIGYMLRRDSMLRTVIKGKMERK